MSIEKHRKAIDKIDAEIVKRLNDRTRHVLEIGKAKIANGEEIYAPHRESDLLRRLKKATPAPLPMTRCRPFIARLCPARLRCRRR